LRVIMAILIGLVMPLLVVQLCKPPVPSSDPQDTPGEVTSGSVSDAPVTRISVLLPSGENCIMNMEEYLVGVILAEMPTTYEMTALQAQAVVARTYACKRQMEQRHADGAVCTDSACCQAYLTNGEYLNGLGYEEDIRIAKEAVETTKGLILTYQGSVIEATYFHCSGGRTEEALAVWGVDYPYLRSVDSPGEENMEHFSDRVFFSKENLEQKLSRELSSIPKDWVGWTTYTTGGGVDKMNFDGTIYRGVDLRRMLGLYSTAFTVAPAEDGVWITTLGKGHRVGMSQSGAQAMACSAKTLSEILNHYYPGTRIDKMQDVG